MEMQKPNESKILVVQMVVFKHEFSARPKSKNHFSFNLFWDREESEGVCLDFSEKMSQSQVCRSNQ